MKGIYYILYVLFVCLSIGGCRPTTQSKKPNFIVIYTDDQQYNGIGLYNPLVKTPAIDQLANQSFQFTNAQVAFSLCSPSRAALLTGNYGSKNGVLSLGSSLKSNQKTISQYLNDAGYTCGLSGKWHIKQEPGSLGFDFCSFFRANGSYYGREVIHGGDTLYPEMHVDEFGVRQSIAFIESCHDKELPFFLFHCPQTPHMNGELIWDAKEETKQKYRIGDMPVPANHMDSLFQKPDYLQSVRNRMQAHEYGYPDSLAIQKHTRDYYAVISELDSFLGLLFDRIESLGLMNNTYLIFMSDNGWMLGDHGFTSKVLPYETSTHVPFWVAGPDIQPGVNASLVSNLDIFPTIIELADLEMPPLIDGRSLLPILHGESKEVREHFIYEGLGTYGGSRHNLTLIRDKLRYIVSYEDETLAGIAYRELYDRQTDPLELHNLIHRQEYIDEIESMDQIFSEFIRRK